MTQELDDLERKVGLLAENSKLREELEKLQQEFDKVPAQYKPNSDSKFSGLFEKHKSFFEDLYTIYKQEYSYKIGTITSPSKKDVEKYFSALHPADQELLASKGKNTLLIFLGKASRIHNYYVNDYHQHCPSLEPLGGLGGGIIGTLIGTSAASGICYTLGIDMMLGLSIGFLCGFSLGAMVGAVSGYRTTQSDTYLKKEREYEDYKQRQTDKEQQEVTVHINHYAHDLTEIHLSSQKSAIPRYILAENGSKK